MSKTMPESQRSLYARLLLRAVLWTAGVLAAIFVAPPLLSLFAPFIIAYLLAAMLNPLVSKVRAKIGAPRKALSILLVGLVYIALLALIFMVVRAVFGQALALAANLPSILGGFQSVIRFMSDSMEGYLEYLPPDIRYTLTGIVNNVAQWLGAVIQGLFLALLATARPASMRIGSWALQSVFAVIAAYYFTAEYHLHGDWMRRHLGKSVFAKYHMIKNAIQSALGKYLKAQLIMGTICFMLMFPALLLYGQSYAFLIALCIAILDFLPFFGAPALLLPWGTIVMLGGDIQKGVFLFALMAVFFMIRRVFEPKIVGGAAGLHPMVALVGIYVGIRLGGILGALLGPVLLMAAISIVRAGVFGDAIADVKSAGADVARWLRRGEGK